MKTKIARGTGRSAQYLVIVTTALLLLSACMSKTAIEPVQTADRGAVAVAAHPEASRAAMEILERGGSAIDAAIAAQAMLGLVEPQSSGIGGGAFLLYHDAKTGRLSAYNGREKAPAGAKPDMLLDNEGRPLPRSEAMLGGRATGVPGVLAMLQLAHADHGILPWAAPFDPAIALAKKGYPLTSRTERYVHGSYPQSGTRDVRSTFSSRDGELLRKGDIFRNDTYADTLRRIAKEGVAAFYDSAEIAGAIVEKTGQPPLSGTMTRQDLRQYAAQRVEPLCRPYRIYLVCVPRRRRAASRCCRFWGYWSGPILQSLAQQTPRHGFCSPKQAVSPMPTAIVMSVIPTSLMCRSRRCLRQPISPAVAR